MELLIDGRALGAEGGIGRATRHLVEELRSVRPSWHLTAAVSGRDDMYLPSGTPLEIQDVGRWRARGSLPNLAVQSVLWPSFNFRRYALDTRPDCIWCPNFYAPIRKLPCPLVLSIYDLRFFEMATPIHPGRRLWVTSIRKAIAASAKVASAIVVPSEYVAASVRANLELARHAEIWTIPLGATRAPTDPGPLPFGVTEPFILCVGSEPWRRHSLVARALSDLSSRGTELSLVIVGRLGHLAPETFPRNLVVHTVGAVPDDVLWALYAHATALCVASPVEGFGLPAVEAMSLGTPVVVAAAGALPEVVAEGGLVVADDSVPAWSEAIRMVAEDSEGAAQLCEAARLRAAEFSWSRAANQLAELIERL
jgi:glycosyltransferase involved in cell wall biosynthesis